MGYPARTDFNNKKKYDIFCSDTIMYVLYYMFYRLLFCI